MYVSHFVLHPVGTPQGWTTSDVIEEFWNESSESTTPSSGEIRYSKDRAPIFWLLVTDHFI